MFRVGGVVALQLLFQQGDALSLLVDVGLVFLGRVEQGRDQFVAHAAGEALHQFAREFGLLVDGKAEAKPEFRVVFEQGIGPGRASPIGVLRPRRRRQVAAIDGRAAGGVGDQRTIPEQLREQLEIGRLAAARTGSRELEQRLLDLLLPDGADLDFAAVEFRDLQEEFPVVALGLAQGRLWSHIQRLQPRFLLVLDGTDVHADSAAGAVFRRHLDAVLEACPFLIAHLGGLESRGRSVQFLRIEHLDANHRVRADHRALAALDADLRVPYRDFKSQVAFLPFGGSGGEGAVHREHADREFFSAISINRAQHVALEVGRVGGEGGGNLERAGHLRGNFHFVQVGECLVHRLHVLPDDLFALAAVGVADGLANGLNGLIARQDFGDGKEAHLQDGVHAAAHAGIARHLVAVDHEEAGFLGNELLLHQPGQLVPDFFGAERAVQQERAAFDQRAEHVVALQEYPLVAGDEVRLGDQIGRADRLRTEAQVRHGDGSRLLGVVNEVALRVVVGILANDLDGVLVRAHRAIGSEAIEQSPHHAVRFGGIRRVVVEAGVTHVVVDADREILFWCGRSQVVIHRLDHRRSEFLGRQPVTSAHHFNGSLSLVQRVHDVEIQGIARRPGFFGSIEYRNPLCAGGQGGQQMLHRKRPVQTDFQQAHFLAACVQRFHGLVGGFGA